MKYEILRQAVHLSGLVFIPIAWVAGGAMASVILFIMAIAFFVYSEYVRKDTSLPGIIGELEKRVRDTASRMDRQVKRPFVGAFWFYFGLGIAFLAFPLEVAIATAVILCIGDSLSTLVGIRYGRHKMLGRKSLEGSLVLFISGFLLTAAIVGSLISFLGSVSAAFLELVPEQEGIRNWKNKEMVDDNWIIPVFSGLIMYVALVVSAAA